MTLLRPVLFACSLAFACGGADEDLPDEGPYGVARCNDIRDDIMATLRDSVAEGVLLGSAIACGPEGVVNSSDSFDSRAEPRDVEAVQNTFREACGEYEGHCSTELPDGT